MLDYCLHLLFEVFSLKPPSKATACYLHLFGSFKLHSQPSHTSRRMLGRLWNLALQWPMAFCCLFNFLKISDLPTYLLELLEQPFTHT